MLATKFFYEANSQKKWYLIDAEGLCLGRLSVEIAKILKGKNKPIYTPNTDTGDYVIVINCEKIALTANKAYTKKLYWHTGYAGGIKEARVRDVLNGKTPEKIIQHSVEGMFKHHTKLSYTYLDKLFIYKGKEHPHSAQSPVALDIAKKKPKNKVKI